MISQIDQEIKIVPLIKVQKDTGICNGILLSHKKDRVIYRDVNGCRVCHTEWSKSGREKQILQINTYVWNQKKMLQMNLFAGQE